ncbi:MAG: right-handed parallel beta-helix repeat-containing protein, partial [Bacteroidota bacterium]
MRQLLILLLLIPLLSFAQTTIQPNEKVFGKWNRQGSPYLIEGEAIVPAGKTLTIEPGTVVLFKTGTNTVYGSEGFGLGILRVRGQLIARGTEERMITFGRNGEDGKWGQIYLQGQEKESKLRYCRISHAQYLRNMVPNDNGTAAVTFYRCGGEVSHCIISDSWAGVNGKKEAKPVLFHNVFLNNKYGLEANSNSRLVAYNSIFVGNESDFFIKGNGKIELSYSMLSGDSSPEGVEVGEGMIFGGSPFFVNGEEGDYHLAPGSLGIQAGKKQVDMGAFPDAHTARVKKDPALATNKRRRNKEAEEDNQPRPQQAVELAGVDPHYYALLIGVKSYDDRDIDKKKKAHRQVRKLRSLLTHRYGFAHEKVLLLENPTKAEIVAQLERLSDQLSADDHLLICYTGQFEWDEYHQT